MKRDAKAYLYDIREGGSSPLLAKLLSGSEKIIQSF